MGSKCPNVHWRDDVHTPTKRYPEGARIRMYIKLQPGSPCPFFARDSGCRRGDDCIFKHGEDDERDLAKVWEDYKELLESSTGQEAKDQAQSGEHAIYEHIWTLGQQLIAEYDGEWFLAKARKVNKDGSVDVEYEDLSVEKAVPLHRLAPHGEAVAELTDAEYCCQTFQHGQQVSVE